VKLKRQRLIVALLMTPLVLIIAGWCFFLASPWHLRSTATTHVTAAQLKACESTMRFTFPDGCEPLGLFVGGYGDRRVKLKLRLPRADVDKLLAASPFAESSLSEDTSFVSHDSPGGAAWWDVESAVRFESQTVRLAQDDGRPADVAILIRRDNDANAIVYLEWRDVRDED
jgi:hypothetical protein